MAFLLSSRQGALSLPVPFFRSKNLPLLFRAGFLRLQTAFVVERFVPFFFSARHSPLKRLFGPGYGLRTLPLFECPLFC